MKRVTIISSASGSGKSTLGRQLATLLDVPYVELDAIHWLADWNELEAAEFRRRVTELVAADAWVVDGSYRGKLGDLVLEAADTIVWLDLPRRVWLPRLVWRTFRRALTHEELWNGNRESFRQVFRHTDSLVRYALRNEEPRRHRYPREFACYRVARLRSQGEVDAFVRSVSDLGRTDATFRPDPDTVAR